MWGELQWLNLIQYNFKLVQQHDVMDMHKIQSNTILFNLGSGNNFLVK